MRRTFAFLCWSSDLPIYENTKHEMWFKNLLHCTLLINIDEKKNYTCADAAPNQVECRCPRQAKLRPAVLKGTKYVLEWTPIAVWEEKFGTATRELVAVVQETVKPHVLHPGQWNQCVTKCLFCFMLFNLWKKQANTDLSIVSSTCQSGMHSRERW